MICVSESEMKIITDILRSYISNGEVRAFGSRYKWTSKDYSDLDIAIVQYDKKSMPIMKLAEIKEAFEDSELPYRVDVLDYWGISSEFQAIIDTGYEVIYKDEVPITTASTNIVQKSGYQNETFCAVRTR